MNVTIKDYVDVTKLKILRWGEYSGLPRCVQCDHRAPNEREAVGLELGKETGLDTTRLTFRMEEGAICKECGWPVKPAKTSKQILS